MQKFYLLKNKLNDQFCFAPPHRLLQIKNPGKDYKKNTTEELIQYSQNNQWPSSEKQIEQIQLKLTNKCNYS